MRLNRFRRRYLLGRDLLLRRKLINVPTAAKRLDELDVAGHLRHSQVNEGLLLREQGCLGRVEVNSIYAPRRSLSRLWSVCRGLS
jgi:hypothetical protein